MEPKILKTSQLDTPLGTMIVISNENALYLLEFVDRLNLEQEIDLLKHKTQSIIVTGPTSPINSITKELDEYFNNKLQAFKTPINLIGSLFQKSVWQELNKIPFGQTKSYSQIASAINKPSAFRAVARANSTNQLAIIIPCHRVININGELGGYSSGITRKKWLINHEKNLIQS